MRRMWTMDRVPCILFLGTWTLMVLLVGAVELCPFSDKCNGEELRITIGDKFKDSCGTTMRFRAGCSLEFFCEDRVEICKWISPEKDCKDDYYRALCASTCNSCEFAAEYNSNDDMDFFDTECNDKLPACQKKVRDGLCREPFVARECAKSCGYCLEESPSASETAAEVGRTCRDVLLGCGQRKLDGKCEVISIAKNCKDTCGLCDDPEVEPTFPPTFEPDVSPTPTSPPEEMPEEETQTSGPCENSKSRKRCLKLLDMGWCSKPRIKEVCAGVCNPECEANLMPTPSPTVVPEECNFTDCNGDSFVGLPSEIITDTCGVTWQFLDNCKLRYRSSAECLYTDVCDNQRRIWGEIGGELVDGCGRVFSIGQLCELALGTAPRCDYLDGCDKSKIWAEPGGQLTDSCGVTYDVNEDCSLSRAT